MWAEKMWAAPPRSPGIPGRRIRFGDQLYTADEVQKGYIKAVDRQGNEVRCKLMALSVGVAHTQYRYFKSAKKMFEVLAQVRQMAHPKEGSSMVFVDRRRSDR